jgi:predicted flap endonuclease-1-like 5' DNA nuclease
MYGHFNPFESGDAWWQHILMLIISAVLGYIIGYITRKSEVENLEAELAELEISVDNCKKSKKVATVVVPLTNSISETTSIVALPEPILRIIPDDLKVVEGIGPKIEQLLNNEGILTFAQLAATAPSRIKEILVAGGSRFQMHDPTTWPDQSAFARDGKWTELKTWQDELNKGRKG